MVAKDFCRSVSGEGKSKKQVVSARFKKVYGMVELQLHSFLISISDGVEWLALCATACPVGKDLHLPLVGFCVDLRAQLEVWERKKCSCPVEGQHPNKTVNVRDVDEEELRSKKNESAAILASHQRNTYLPTEPTLRIISHF
jgi:hypothetical protein